MKTQQLILLLFYASGLLSCNLTPKPWTLVWSDEFDGPSIDTGKWGYEIGMIRNNEAQYYTGRPENSYVESGNLVIKAIREDYLGAAYTSASLNTSGKYSWTYGRFEMRARIPTALGNWPAWWALGTNASSAGWPACGEIDMMEFYRSISLYNIMDSHQSWFNNTEAFTDSSGYHDWVMEWTSSRDIRLYRDDVLKTTYTGGDPAFAKPFFMLVNLAIGGNNGGDPAGTTFPQYYYIDYIRVYQRQ
jgi:beta-glucanase (GH16 family)